MESRRSPKDKKVKRLFNHTLNNKGTVKDYGRCGDLSISSVSLVLCARFRVSACGNDFAFIVMETMIILFIHIVVFVTNYSVCIILCGIRLYFFHLYCFCCCSHDHVSLLILFFENTKDNRVTFLSFHFAGKSVGRGLSAPVVASGEVRNS